MIINSHTCQSSCEVGFNNVRFTNKKNVTNRLRTLFASLRRCCRTCPVSKDLCVSAMTCWKFSERLNRSSLKTGHERYCLDWLIPNRESGRKHCIQPFKYTRLLQYPLPSVKVTSFSICPASRPVTVSWSWIMWTADWRSSIQTDWSVCSVRSGSSLLWAFPFQLRYNRLLILRIIFTDRPLSWNRSEFECRQKTLLPFFPLSIQRQVNGTNSVIGGPLLQHHWPADDSFPETHDA